MRPEPYTKKYRQLKNERNNIIIITKNERNNIPQSIVHQLIIQQLIALKAYTYK